MSITLAKLLVIVGSDTAEAEKGLKDVNSALKGSQEIGRTALGVLGGQLMMSAIRGIAGLAGQAVASYASFERLGMSLNSLTAREAMLTGKANSMAEGLELTRSKAQALLATTQRLAILSPFSQTAVSTLTQTTMGYGMASDMSMRLTQSLVDLASATGRGEKDMNMMGLALGQVWAKGKLTGEEMRQLTNAGITVTDVARAMQIPISEVASAISAGEVAARDFIPALIDIINTDFGGEAERQAVSWASLLTTFSDIREINLREFFSGAMQALQPLAQELAETLGSPEFQQRIKEMGLALGDTIGDLIQGGRDLVAMWSSLPEPVQGAVAAFAGVFLVGPQVISAFVGITAAGAKLALVMGQLQSGVGFFTVASQGAIGLAGALLPVAAAVAAITAAFVAYRKVQDTIEQGNESASKGWDNYIARMVAGGANAQEMMAGMASKQAELNSIMESQGPIAAKLADIMGANVAPSIEQVTNALAASGASYDEYVAHILDYLVAIGQVPDFERDAYAEMMMTGEAIEEISGRLGVLTPEMYQNTAAVVRQANAVSQSSKRWHEYQLASLSAYLSNQQSTQGIEEQNIAMMESADILSTVSDVLMGMEESGTVLDNLSIAMGVTSEAALQLERDVDMLAQAYAAGLIGEEQFTRGMLAARDGTLDMSNAQRQALQGALELAEAQGVSAEAASIAAGKYWNLAESLKGAGQAEIAKTLVSELTKALDDGKITPEQYGIAMGELGDAFGISDKKSRALAMGIPLLSTALGNGLIPMKNADEALKFLIKDAQDGKIDFDKLLETWGEIPEGAEAVSRALSQGLIDPLSNDIPGAFRDAANAKEDFQSKLIELKEWIENNPFVITVTFPDVVVPPGGSGGGGGYSPPVGGGGSGGSSGGSSSGGGGGGGASPQFVVHNHNYDREAAAFSAAYTESLTRERLSSHA